MNSEMLNMLIIAGITVAVMAVLITLFSAVKRKSRNNKYCELFSIGYDDGRGVLETLKMVQSSFSAKSVEYLVIERSVRYLTNSCLRDYQTAFAMIEDVFQGKNVENLHDEIMTKEKNRMVLLIEKKGDF